MVITYSSLKGGVGKTTDAILTATNLAKRGKHVLFFDLDPNNSGTMYFCSGIDGITDLIETHNTFESLSHNNVANYKIQSRIANIDIVPSHLNIFKLRGCGYNELQKTLRGYENTYDCVIIDTAPTYDNLVINALTAADYIITPIEFSSFNLTTTSYLQKQLYDDCPQQVGNWYLLYSHWEESRARFENSTQTQFVKVFQSQFQNILDIHIPETPAANYYTQTDTPLSTTSRVIGARRLAIEINRLVKMLTNENPDDGSKWAERF